MGLILGCLDGAAEIDGLSLGMDDGWADKLGDADAANEGTALFEGLILGWLDG